VAYFRPLKSAWREVLAEWKRRNIHSSTSLPKHEFPRLLKETLERIEYDGRGTRNVIAGFEKAGISPLDRQKVIEQLPDRYQETAVNDISDKLVTFLKEMRYRPSEKRIIRRKKVDVKPGCSVSLDDFEPSDDDSYESSMDFSSVCSKEESNDDSSCISDTTEAPRHVPDEERSPSQSHKTIGDCKTPKLGSLKDGEWVLIGLKNKKSQMQKFVAQIQKVYDNYEFEVSFLTPYRNEPQQFIWPEVKDIADIEFSDILQTLHDPTSLRRGVLLFTDVSS
jgi:hypothetical protein